MKRTGGSGMIAALILACLFATTMLLTLVMGARVYRGVQARVEASAEGRVGLAYITAKVHGNDHAGGISVQDFGGVDAVVLESHKNWADKSPVKSFQLSAEFMNRYV